MVIITPGHFFQWSVELYPFKPGRSSVIHWNRKIPSNSFIRVAWPISFVNEPAHDSTLRVKEVMIRNGLAAGQCLACVFQNIPTHDQWFGLCNKGSPVAWLSDSQTEENVSRASGTLQGLRCYQSSCERSKSSLETVNNGEKLTKLAEGGRERGRERTEWRKEK